LKNLNFLPYKTLSWGLFYFRIYGSFNFHGHNNLKKKKKEMNASQSWLYSTYRDAGPAFPLVVSALSMNAVALPGFLMNAFLCYTTLRCKWGIKKCRQKIK
jgi:hypothetical protein